MELFLHFGIEFEGEILYPISRWLWVSFTFLLKKKINVNGSHFIFSLSLLVILVCNRKTLDHRDDSPLFSPINSLHIFVFCWSTTHHFHNLMGQPIPPIIIPSWVCTEFQKWNVLKVLEHFVVTVCILFHLYGREQTVSQLFI